jgi:arylsulfatase
MVDDQGYGDVKAHGHPFIRTPHMDRLHSEAVRFTDFHVAPMCTPTRGQLLTGVDAMKNGATAVCQGRSMIRREIPTVANYFGEAGYKTILSGKWHLGDSYPHRPQDRGFQEVLSFRAWGVPSLASHWDNSFINPDIDTDAYHNPTLEHNGKDKEYEGYVTDILFDHAMQEMLKCKNADTPFFLYVATPTPHVPDIPKKGTDLQYYKKLRKNHKALPVPYYGMIDNIDDNLGRLEAFLKKEDLRDNTILLYLSDNGTQSWQAGKIYNAGMRGIKTQVYDGGHRVPLFVRWTNGKLKHGTDVKELTQVQDLCPTLLALCGIKPANLYPQSGHDLSPLLRGETWPHADRILFVQYMIGGKPWKPAAAMQGSWRLVNGRELYNIARDPGQRTNSRSKNPERFNRMHKAYQAWYAEARKDFKKTRYIDLGHPDAPSVILYASDWEGSYCDNPGGLAASKGKGAWHVDVIRPGTYRIELARWPFESEKKLTERVNPTSEKFPRTARPIARASVTIGSASEEKPTNPDDTTAVFEIKLTAGKQKLKTRFYNAQSQELCSANYARVTLITRDP